MQLDLAFSQSYNTQLRHLGGFPPAATYTNPLSLHSGVPGSATSCPDPAIISEQTGSLTTWYLYCTGDPLSDLDRDQFGTLRKHMIAIYRSNDLTDWTYTGDAFTVAPSWVNARPGLWAAAIKHFNNRYYLYFVAPSTLPADGGSAIGVATAPSPTGPWTDSGRPLIPSGKRDTIDPDVIADDEGQLYISFGSYWGGISIAKLSPDGLTADLASLRQIAVDNRYEGASFYHRNGYYYLFVSAANCCAGPLTGYTGFVGRSLTPLGPFLDANGQSLSASATGGTLMFGANGNRWIGPGGGVVFDDAEGQSYMLYHAVDAQAPWFSQAPHLTRRPVLLDPVDWIDDWPVIRGGWGPSATPQPAPSAQTLRRSNYTPISPKQQDRTGELIAELSDEFNQTALSPQWRFIHGSARNEYRLTGAEYEAATTGADENADPARAPILAELAPAEGNYIVETRVTTSVPFDGSCCYNFAQAALFIYGDDQNSIKLALFANFETRQIEFGKQIVPDAAGYPAYGNTVVGTAAPTACLRIAVNRDLPDSEQYTSYSSQDCVQWVRGSTWVHHLGSGQRIGLAAQGPAGQTMRFDYVRVFRPAN